MLQRRGLTRHGSLEDMAAAAKAAGRRQHAKISTTSQSHMQAVDLPISRVASADTKLSRQAAMSFRYARDKGIELLKRARSFFEVNEADSSDDELTNRNSDKSFVTCLETQTTPQSHLPHAESSAALPGTPVAVHKISRREFHPAAIALLPATVIATEHKRELEREAAAVEAKVAELERLKRVKQLQSREEAPQIAEIDPNCPVHSNKTIRRIHFQEEEDAMIARERLFSLASSMSYSGLSTDYIQRVMRKNRKQRLTYVQKLILKKEKGKLYRNLYTISFAFLFIIMSFQALQNLQTCINQKQGLGAIALCMVYVGWVVSCLFIPPFLLNRLGCKMTLVVSTSVYALYMLIQLNDRWYTLLPASFVLGCAAAALWTAQCTYITEIGLRYAEINLDNPTDTVNRFFGTFYMILNLGQVFGNLISFNILTTVSPHPKPFPDQIEPSCGHYFIPNTVLSVDAAENLKRPPNSAVQALCGVFFATALISTMIVVLFLNQLRRDYKISKEKPRFKPEVWNETVAHMKNARHILLIPITIYNGMEQAFIVAEFTQAYVACCLGIPYVGAVMTLFGVCTALCSLIFGPLLKLFGRMPLFMFATVVDMLMIFTCLCWPPNPADTSMFYVVAATWGMADGVWNTQISGLWSVLYSQNMEVSYANYRLWESVGFIIVLLYTAWLPTRLELIILLCMLLIGITGYCLVEFWDHVTDRWERVTAKLMHQISKRKRSHSLELLDAAELMKSSWISTGGLSQTVSFDSDRHSDDISDELEERNL